MSTKPPDARTTDGPTLVFGSETLSVGVVGLDMGQDDVVRHLVHTHTRVTDARSEDSNAVPQPRHHEGFIERDP